MAGVSGLRASVLALVAPGTTFDRLIGRRLRRRLRQGDRSRLVRLEAQTAQLSQRIDGLAADIDGLRAVMVKADPEQMREITEALRTDVTALTAEVNTRLAALREVAPPTATGPTRTGTPSTVTGQG